MSFNLKFRLAEDIPEGEIWMINPITEEYIVRTPSGSIDWNKTVENCLKNKQIVILTGIKS